MRIMYSEILPLAALYSILLGISTPILALRTTIHLPPAPLRPLNVSLAEPQPLRCYTELDRAFAVSERVCGPVIDKMNERRDRARYQIFRSVDCPLTFTAPGTPCEIRLDSLLPRIEDSFTPRNIVQKAIMILDECDYESFGGVATLGYKGFVVKVDSGLEVRLKLAGKGGNGTATDR